MTCVAGLEALSLPEDGTIKAASSFLSHFLALSRDSKGAMYEPVVRQNTEHFLRTLITCICEYCVHLLLVSVSTAYTYCLYL